MSGLGGPGPPMSHVATRVPPELLLFRPSTQRTSSPGLGYNNRPGTIVYSVVYNYVLARVYIIYVYYIL